MFQNQPLSGKLINVVFQHLEIFSDAHIYIMSMHQKTQLRLEIIFNCKFTIFIIYQPFSVLTLSFVINLTGIKMVGDSGFLPFKMSFPT